MFGKIIDDWMASKQFKKSAWIKERLAIGDRAEEMLIQMLKERGYEAVRLSQSPLGRRNYPDVVACKDGKWYVFEVKSLTVKGDTKIIKGKVIHTHPHVTVKKHQLAKCFRYLRNRKFEGDVYVVALFRRQGEGSRWAFRKVDNARRDVKVPEPAF
jgi:Holliday junction resolvase